MEAKTAKSRNLGSEGLKKILVSLSALSLSLLVVAACVGNTSTGDAETDEPTASDSPIEFVMEDNYVLGQDIEIKIRNNGTGSFVYSEYYPACRNLEFYDESEEAWQLESFSQIVELPHGLFIIPAGTHCDLANESQIRPGEEVVLLTWSQQECVKDTWGCAESVPVKEGKYTIVGKFPESKGSGNPNAPWYEKGDETIAEWSFIISQEGAVWGKRWAKVDSGV